MDIFKDDAFAPYPAPVKRYYDAENGMLLTASQALVNARYRLIPSENGWNETELLVCDRPKFNPHHYGLVGDAPHRRCRDDDDDDDAAATLDRSRRRARKAIKDIMDCNRFEYFMTFTLDAEKIDRQSYSAFVRAVNVYMRNRVQRYGWRYLAVPEYHKDGESLHLHAVVAGDRYNLVDSGTVLRPDHVHGKKPVTVKTALRQGYRREDLKTVYNVTDWTLGYSTAIRCYGDPVALRRYIGKYITKSEDKIGGRWYFSGGELQRPLYICCNMPYDDVAADLQFENDGGAFKLVYLDRKGDDLSLSDGA